MSAVSDGFLSTNLSSHVSVVCSLKLVRPGMQQNLARLPRAAPNPSMPPQNVTAAVSMPAGQTMTPQVLVLL